MCNQDNIGKNETVPYLLQAFRQIPWVNLEQVSNNGECDGTRRLLPFLRSASPCGKEKAWDADQQENSGCSQGLHSGLRKRSQVSEKPDAGPVNPCLFICCGAKARGWNEPIVPSYSCWDMSLLINLLMIRMNVTEVDFVIYVIVLKQW